jgi:hypothetical protein
MPLARKFWLLCAILHIYTTGMGTAVAIPSTNARELGSWSTPNEGGKASHLARSVGVGGDGGPGRRQAEVSVEERHQNDAGSGVVRRASVKKTRGRPGYGTLKGEV